MNTIDCVCGKSYIAKDKYYIIRHNSSNYHQTFLLSGITPAERLAGQKLHKNEYQKEYYETNKEKFMASSKAYYYANIEIISQKKKDRKSTV